MDYLWVIILTFVGFSALAALLLIPVYRFLERERRSSEAWTPEGLAERAGDKAGGNAGGNGAVTPGRSAAPRSPDTPPSDAP